MNMFRFFLLTSLFILQTNFITPSDTNKTTTTPAVGAPASKVQDSDSSDDEIHLTVTQEQLQEALATRQARISAEKARAAMLIRKQAYRHLTRQQRLKGLEAFKTHNANPVEQEDTATPAVPAPESKVASDSDSDEASTTARLFPTVYMRYTYLVGAKQLHQMFFEPNTPEKRPLHYKLPKNTDPNILTILLQPMPTSPTKEVLTVADNGFAHSNNPISSTMVATTISSTDRKQKNYK